MELVSVSVFLYKYLIELDGKDPSDLGFTSMTELLQKAKPLTFGELMLRRMKMN